MRIHANEGFIISVPHTPAPPHCCPFGLHHSAPLAELDSQPEVPEVVLAHWLLGSDRPIAGGRRKSLSHITAGEGKGLMVNLTDT